MIKNRHTVSFLVLATLVSVISCHKPVPVNVKKEAIKRPDEPKPPERADGTPSLPQTTVPPSGGTNELKVKPPPENKPPAESAVPKQIRRPNTGEGDSQDKD